MPKHRIRKHWNPGFQRDNRQNAYNSYQNFQGNYNNSYFNQRNYIPNASNYYGRSSFQTNNTQNYRNNYFERGFHRNFPQVQSHNQHFQNDNLYFQHGNLNFQHYNFTTNFNQNFQRNFIQQSSNSTNNFIAQCNTSRNDSTTNTRKNIINSNNNPWIKNPPTSHDRWRKKWQGFNFFEDYEEKTEIFTDKGYIIKETLYRDPSLFYGNNKSLGKAGDSIVEPIVPTCTVNTIGPGHTSASVKPKEPILFANVKNKKLKHPEFQDNFFTNLLLYILEFVKNDEENKIVFEPRLRKWERNRIGQIVEKIRESDNLKDFKIFDNFSEKHFELVKKIWMHNYYELWTDIEGGKKNILLCLFKEAPAYVYLVTPEDLTEKDESNIIDDKNGKDYDISVHNIKKEKDLEYSDTGKGNIADSINYDKNCNSGQKANIKIYDCTERKIDKLLQIKKEIADPTDFQVVADINMDENDQIVVKNENNGEKITKKINDIDLRDKIIPKTEINEQIIVKQEINTSKVTDVNMGDEIKVKMEINELLINIKQEIDENEEYIKKEDKKDATNSILAKIVKYFKEFSSDATFKEFRFLGPFDSEQIMHINMFFNICMKLDEIECDEKIELLAAFDNDLVKFYVLEDNNGKKFIQKVAESPKLSSADDDVICIS